MPNIKILNRDIETSLYILALFLALVSLGGFGIFRFINGEFLLSFIDLTVSALFAYALVQVLRNTLTDNIKLLLVIVSMIAVCAVIYSKGKTSTYWAYPPITGAFFFLGIRKAIPINIIFIMTVLAILSTSTPITEFFSILSSLVLICLFGYTSSARSDHNKKQLRKLAELDPLTTLNNRRYLQEELLKEIDAHRRGIHNSSLILLDLDHFKKVNDDYGHTVGDNILVQFSRMLKSVIRETDKVYRYGGEEFIIIANNTRLENAGKLAESLRQMTENTISVNKKAITVSIGVAEVDNDDSAISWLHRADHALYKAKNANRNIVYLACGGKQECQYKAYLKDPIRSEAEKRASKTQ